MQTTDADQIFAPEHDPQVHDNATTEPTMLYREPIEGSDESNVHEIWGRKVETIVVDAPEVPALLADGWVKSPLECGEQHIAPPRGEAKTDATAAVANAKGDALAAAEKLVVELGEKVKNLTAKVEDLEKSGFAKEAEFLAVIDAKNAALADLETERTLRSSASEHIRNLEAELKELKAKAPKK